MSATAFRRLALALALGALPASSVAAQSADPEPVYRVEVIVFEHLDGRSDRRRADRPADFTGLPDPLLIARAATELDRWRAALAAWLPLLPEPDRAAGQPDAAYLESEQGRVQPLPVPMAAQQPLSAPMRRALDRLDGADAYRPEIVRAWFQTAPAGRATPWLRLHDARPVAERPAAGGPPLFWPDLADLAGRAEPDLPGALVRLFGQRPPALDIYRLDGRARLRRRQFLHLEFDLVLQQRGEDPMRAGAGAPGRPPGPAPGAAADRDAGWRLHRLRQARPVRPERFEYFDSSRFGVLARLTRFTPVVPEPAAPPDSGPVGTGTAQSPDPDPGQ